MIVETRTLSFSGKELVEATVRHVRGTKTDVGSGQVEAVVPDKADGGSVILKMAADGGGHSETRLSAGFMGAALIRYCITERIMVPRRATKKVTIGDESVTLEFVMNLKAHNVLSPG